MGLAPGLELDAAVALDHPSMAASAELSVARATIASFRPHDEAQRDFQARMLAFIDAHPADAHLRTQLAGHLTASALVIDSEERRGLLTHHRKLGFWLQLGGHCDGDANLAAGALRECWEESGIEGLRVLPTPIDLDVHPIPARPGEPEHLHLDTRFVVLAPPGAREVVSHESLELGWFTEPELAGIDTDDSVARLFRLALR